MKYLLVVVCVLAFSHYSSAQTVEEQSSFADTENAEFMMFKLDKIRSKVDANEYPSVLTIDGLMTKDFGAMGMHTEAHLDDSGIIRYITERMDYGPVSFKYTYYFDSDGTVIAYVETEDDQRTMVLYDNNKPVLKMSGRYDSAREDAWSPELFEIDQSDIETFLKNSSYLDRFTKRYEFYFDN